jgi:hypothetical protein
MVLTTNQTITAFRDLPAAAPAHRAETNKVCRGQAWKPACRQAGFLVYMPALSKQARSDKAGGNG